MNFTSIPGTCTGTSDEATPAPKGSTLWKPGCLMSKMSPFLWSMLWPATIWQICRCLERQSFRNYTSRHSDGCSWMCFLFDFFLTDSTMVNCQYTISWGICVGTFSILCKSKCLEKQHVGTWEPVLFEPCCWVSKDLRVGFCNPSHRIPMIQFDVFQNVFYLGISEENTHELSNSDDRVL